MRSVWQTSKNWFFIPHFKPLLEFSLIAKHQKDFGDWDIPNQSFWHWKNFKRTDNLYKPKKSFQQSPYKNPHNQEKSNNDDSATSRGKSVEILTSHCALQYSLGWVMRKITAAIRADRAPVFVLELGGEKHDR